MAITSRILPAALAAAAAITVVGAAPASAAVFTHRLQVPGTNQCLQGVVSSAGDLHLAACKADGTQLWRWSAPATATTLRHEQTGRCATRVGAGQVDLGACGGTAQSQRWNVLHRIGHVVIKATGAEQCLDHGVARDVLVRPCDGSADQQWKLA